MEAGNEAMEFASHIGGFKVNVLAITESQSCADPSSAEPVSSRTLCCREYHYLFEADCDFPGIGSRGVRVELERTQRRHYSRFASVLFEIQVGVMKELVIDS